MFAKHVGRDALTPHTQIGGDFAAQTHAVLIGAHTDHARRAEMAREHLNPEFHRIGHHHHQFLAMAALRQHAGVAFHDLGIDPRKLQAADHLTPGGRRGGAGREQDEVGGDVLGGQCDIDLRRDFGISVVQISAQPEQGLGRGAATPADQLQALARRQQLARHDLDRQGAADVAIGADDCDIHSDPCKTAAA